MKTTVAVLTLSALVLSGCKPPAPNPEIERKPKQNTGDTQNPGGGDPFFNPAKEQVWSKIIEENVFNSQPYTRQDSVVTEEIKLTSVLYHGKYPSHSENTKKYEISYPFADSTSPYASCASGSTFKLFCAANPNNPAQEFAVSTSTVKVYVTSNGTESETKGFTLNAAAKSVTLNLNALPSTSGGKVRIVFAPGEVGIPISKHIVASSLKVSIANVALASDRFSYSSTTGIITVKAPSVDPFLLSMEYDINSPGTVIKIPNGATDIKLTDASGTALTFKAYPDRIVMNQSDYVEGKVVRVSYITPNIEIALQHTPIKDTLKVDTNIPNCSIGSGIVLDGQKLTVTCNTTGIATVEITYSYKYASNSFPIEVTDPNLGEWSVEANGKPVQFERVGNVIQLKEVLPNGTELIIKFTRAV